jgi:hypothetical protein
MNSSPGVDRERAVKLSVVRTCRPAALDVGVAVGVAVVDSIFWPSHLVIRRVAASISLLLLPVAAYCCFLVVFYVSLVM